jgi:hypothetical protein
MNTCVLPVHLYSLKVLITVTTVHLTQCRCKNSIGAILTLGVVSLCAQGTTVHFSAGVSACLALIINEATRGRASIREESFRSWQGRASWKQHNKDSLGSSAAPGDCALLPLARF